MQNIFENEKAIREAGYATVTSDIFHYRKIKHTRNVGTEYYNTCIGLHGICTYGLRPNSSLPYIDIRCKPKSSPKRRRSYSKSKPEALLVPIGWQPPLPLHLHPLRSRLLRANRQLPARYLGYRSSSRTQKRQYRQTLQKPRPRPWA